MQDTLDHQAQDAAKTAAAPLWSLSDAEVVDCLHTAHRWENSIAALKARLVGEITGRDIPARHGHRSIPRWLSTHLLIDPQPARELAAHAAALHAHPSLEQAVLDGRIDLRQTVAIADTLHTIPATLTNLDPDPATASGLDPDPATASGLDQNPDPANGFVPDAAATDGSGPGPAAADVPSIVSAAEAALIEFAGRLPAHQLRHCGERILTHVAPEVAERAEEAALRRQEQRAHQTRAFTLSRPVAGLVRVSGVLDVESAAIVQAALQPLCRPTPGDDRTAPQQRADALTDICRLTLNTGQLPLHGGEPAQITVTLAYDPLTRQLRNARLDNGQRLSAATARRLACDARLIPLVLGGDSQILDAGRSRRLAHGPLRRALTVRDKGCALPDCDRPPRWARGSFVTLGSWQTSMHLSMVAAVPGGP